MKIILLERVPNLGIMGELVVVKPGYARNFLLPQKKALRASKAKIEAFDAQRHQLEATNIARRDEAQAIASRMDNVLVSVIRSASEAGHLYGSVRSNDISDALKVVGYTVGRNQVLLTTPIKTLGQHTAKVILHPEVSIDVGVLIARTPEEAVVQMDAIKNPKKSGSQAAEAFEGSNEDSIDSKPRRAKKSSESTIAQAIEAELSGQESE